MTRTEAAQIAALAENMNELLAHLDDLDLKLTTSGIQIREGAHGDYIAQAYACDGNLDEVHVIMQPDGRIHRATPNY